MDIKLNSKIYPLEVILSACYVFIDRAFIFLDGDFKKDLIKVSIKGKRGLSEKQLEWLRGEFMNELLHCALRYKISKSNKKIREYIIGRAIYSALPTKSEELSGYQEDPLGIAIPWEEKFGKKGKKKKNEDP